MNINQAFTILKKHGGIRAARIITEKRTKFSLFFVLKTALKLHYGVPVAKIVHNKWFYGLQFYTNKYTLDPRPDTETLVQAVLNDYKQNNNVSILDLGTGTSCIISSLIYNMPNAKGMALDKSFMALQVAKKNINNLHLNNKIILKHGNFYKKLHLNEQFDIIVSNPPYIAKNDSNMNVGAKHDPKMALYAKNNGYFAYEQIAKLAKTYLKPNGKIYLEIGKNMQNQIIHIFVNNNWIFERAEKDLGNIERVLIFKIA